MTKVVTHYQQYLNELNSTSGREDWEADAAIGHRLSLCSTIGSIFLIFFGLTQARRHPRAAAAAVSAGAAGFLAAREFAAISENKGTIALRANSAVMPKFMQNEKEFSKEIFRGTRVSGIVHHSNYVEWLKSPCNLEEI